MADHDLQEKRIFSYEEANALMPDVRRITEEAYQRVESLSASAGHGTAQMQTRIEEAVTAWAQAILALGVEVKGLWLVDFDNGSGYYCWRHPEPGLHYYHTYEEGFRGRVRIQ
jgi:hypothetical protein